METLSKSERQYSNTKKLKTKSNQIKMKRSTMLLAILLGFLTGTAQTVIDNFYIGPYIVDYNGEGDVKYRLMDNVDLYEFFELKKDTTIVVPIVENPIKGAIQISGNVGANRFAAKEIGIEGVWKQKIGENIYFNGGLSLAIDHSSITLRAKRDMFEIGVPLQIELGKLNHQFSSLYGAFGLTPTFYSTMNTKDWTKGKWEEGKYKKSGFLIAPSLEFGGNIPVGSTIIRIGVYGKYKINCTSSEFDVYKEAGKCFLGAKIGFVL